MALVNHVPPQVLAELREHPDRYIRIGGVGMKAVTAEEGARRGRQNGVQIEERDGRTHAVVECDGVRETIHLSDYGVSRAEREELKRLLTRGRARMVAGPSPHQLASGLHVPKG